MRPRKRIAILGAREIEGSVLALALETRGYAVETLMSEDAAMRIETPAAFLLVGLRPNYRRHVESRLPLRHRGCGIAAVSHREEEHGMWMLEVLRQLRLATEVRPGPKPGHAAARMSAQGELERGARLRRVIA